MATSEIATRGTGTRSFTSRTMRAVVRGYLNAGGIRGRISDTDTLIDRTNNPTIQSYKVGANWYNVDRNGRIFREPTSNAAIRRMRRRYNL